MAISRSRSRSGSERGLRSSAVRSRSIALSSDLYLMNNSASRMAVSTSLTCSDSEELTIVGRSHWACPRVLSGAPQALGGVYHRNFDGSVYPFGIRWVTISYDLKLLRRSGQPA